MVRVRIQNPMKMKQQRDLLGQLCFQDGLTGIANWASAGKPTRPAEANVSSPERGSAKELRQLGLDLLQAEWL